MVYSTRYYNGSKILQRKVELWKRVTNYNKSPRPPTATEHPTVFLTLTLDKNGPRGDTRALVGRQTD